MDIKEKHLVEEALIDFKTINFDKILDIIYSGRSKKEITIGAFSPLEMVQTLVQAIQQLDDAMAVSWKFLPAYSNGAGSAVSIYEHLSTIFNNIVAGHPFELWVDELTWLVQYEMQNSIWTSAAEVQIKNDFKEIKSESGNLIGRLKQNVNESVSLNDRVEVHLKDVQMIHNQFQNEKRLLEISNNEASQTVAELKQLQRELDKANGEVNALLSQLNMRTGAANTAFETEQEKFTKLVSDISHLQQIFGENNQLLEKTNEDFNIILKGAQEKEKHILDQKSEIDKLRGFSADISLGSAFDKRMAQLRLPVLIWGIASLLMIGAAAEWILLVFKTHDSQSASGVNWLILLANVVRTSPAFVLVYFALAQYTKERNLQEEYAFKSAVSMTITAYSEMISEVPERIKMLMAAVQGVYTPPVLGKPFTPFSFRTKDIAEISKNLLDATKNVQKMGVDKLKSDKSNKEDE